MRIDFSVDGGIAAFPGLRKPVTIDCDALAADERSELQDLVRRANLFALHDISRTPTLADARRYTIAIEEGALRTSVTVPEPIQDAALRTLISRLRSYAHAARRP